MCMQSASLLYREHVCTTTTVYGTAHTGAVSVALLVTCAKCGGFESLQRVVNSLKHNMKNKSKRACRQSVTYSEINQPISGLMPDMHLLVNSNAEEKRLTNSSRIYVGELDSADEDESIHFIWESLTWYTIATDEVYLRQDMLDVNTTNGLSVWKILDIHRCYQDTIQMEHRTISLHSPPFYTSSYGYCIPF